MVILWVVASITNANITADHEIQVKGSNIAVGGALQLDAEDINLLAGENSTQTSSDSSSHTESASYSTNGGPSGSLSANKTESSSESQYYTNTQIVAGTLSSDSENLTLSGANVDAGVVDITTENLLVESLQNTSSSNSQTQGANLSLGGVAPPTSGGINQQQSESSSAWVDQQSSITGGNVSIKAKDTTLKGGLIAAQDENGADNGNLNFATDNLTVENIQDHDTYSDKGFSLNTGASTTTVGANYSGHDKRQTTKATIGNGNVTVGGEQLADSNIDVNRDTHNAQEITKDHELGGLDATVTVDHRLASEEGRKSIQKDFVDTTQHAKEIGQAIDDIASTDIGLVDGIKNVDKYAKDRIVLADKAMNEDAQKALKGEKGAENSETELQALSDELTQQEGLAENTDVNLYDGSQTPDDTPVESTNDFNKQLAKAGYHENGENGPNNISDVYLNIDQTDMTNSSDVVKSLVHEQERHSQAQNNSTLNDTDQTTLATNRGEQAQSSWNAYSDLAGIETKSTTTQSSWNNQNRNSENVAKATEQMRDRVNSAEIKPLLPEFVEDARKAVRDHQEKSQQASADLKGDGVGTALSMAAAVGDIVIDVTDGVVTIVDKTTDAIGAVGLFGGDLKAEALDNIARDLSSLESAYDNKQEIATAILTKLQDYPNRLAEMDPSALRSLISVAGEVAIPAAIIAKANKVDVPETPKADMAIADNEIGHSALDQDPVVQALREKDRQGVDPNSNVDASIDNEMIGQDSATDTGIKNPEVGHSNDLNIGQNNENYNQRLNQEITQRGI